MAKASGKSFYTNLYGYEFQSFIIIAIIMDAFRVHMYIYLLSLCAVGVRLYKSLSALLMLCSTDFVALHFEVTAAAAVAQLAGRQKDMRQ